MENDLVKHAKELSVRFLSKKATGAISPPKTCESNFIHHDFVQFGKQHSQLKEILSSIVLSQQCCDVYFTSLRVATQWWDLTNQILLKSPTLNHTGFICTCCEHHWQKNSFICYTHWEYWWHNWRMPRKFLKRGRNDHITGTPAVTCSFGEGCSFSKRDIVKTKYTPISRSHWNDKKTKEACIFIGIQK